ncbi:molybdenum cofactor guanylyltransferase MobA [Candidatus Pantoea multigeneris]|uniref:Molybdenum cofactor guanylyltransferase n=1 Tax=Candidatus Pantoea multigeneris TaxID=2608357 RepID=A0ABX0RFD6_9GAMM|nr:molybdenum cofactor guanylyltransferase MobA [Pantoea multigeneris]NIF24053.1 molybdenum cofactor guanylyltransferase MobA [Pantoea multigeneris]
MTKAYSPYGPQGITGVILAGGQGSRMGGEDKGLVLLNGMPLYQHVLARLRPQVSEVLISANRNLPLYASSGCPVVSDSFPGFAGPLAGILSALQAARSEWVAFCSCDTPAIPQDYIARLWAEKGSATALWVRTTQRDHPTLALIHRSVAADLEIFLHHGDRKLMLFLQQQKGHSVLFEDDESCFRNINTVEDLQQAGQFLLNDGR